MRGKARRILVFFLAVLLVVAAAAMALAENAPLASSEKASTILMPFRVWVLPSAGGSVSTAGHYEYFDLLISGGPLVQALGAPVFETALPSLPAETPGTKP